MVISFKSKFKDPSNRIELVRLFRRCATNEFIRSKGRSSPMAGRVLPAERGTTTGVGCCSAPGLFLGGADCAVRRPCGARGARRGCRSSCGKSISVACASSPASRVEIWLQIFASESFDAGSTQWADWIKGLIARIVLYGEVTTSSSRDGHTHETKRKTSGIKSSKLSKM